MHKIIILLEAIIISMLTILLLVNISIFYSQKIDGNFEAKEICPGGGLIFNLK